MGLGKYSPLYEVVNNTTYTLSNFMSCQIYNAGATDITVTLTNGSVITVPTLISYNLPNQGQLYADITIDTTGGGLANVTAIV